MPNYIPAALIILSVFASAFVGIFLNQSVTNKLREDTNRQFDQMNRQFDQRFEQVNQRFEQVNHRFAEIESTLSVMAADFRQFYGMHKHLEGRVDEMSKH